MLPPKRLPTQVTHKGRIRTRAAVSQSISGTSRELFSIPPIFLGFGFLVYVSGLAFYSKNEGIPFPLPGLSKALAEASMSFSHSGSLEAPFFRNLFDELSARSLTHPGIRYFQDFFSMGSQGELYPKHPYLIPILAAPFYQIAGIIGFWIFTQLNLFLLFVALYFLNKQLVSSRSAAVVVVLIACGSSIHCFSYHFTHELTGFLFALGGIAMFSKRPILGMLLCALSLWIKLTYALIVIPIYFLFAHNARHGWRIRVLAAVSFSTLVFVHLWINHAVWNSPFAGAYARVPEFLDGKTIFRSVYETHYFSFHVLKNEWSIRLFDVREGIFPTNPVLVLAILAIPICARSHQRVTYALLFVIATAYCLTFLSYSFWLKSGGPRFVLPSVFLLSPFCAELIELVLRKMERYDCTK